MAIILLIAFIQAVMAYVSAVTPGADMPSSYLDAHIGLAVCRHGNSGYMDSMLLSKHGYVLSIEDVNIIFEEGTGREMDEREYYRNTSFVHPVHGKIRWDRSKRVLLDDSRSLPTILCGFRHS